MRGLTSSALADVRVNALCAGCGACASIASGVEMRTSAEGYLRPVEVGPVQPAEDALIRAVCPGLGVTRDPSSATAGHAIWGAATSVHRGWATDKDLRRRASSGGALSAMLVHLIETGAVDFVHHTGPDPHAPLANRSVTSEDARAVAAVSGSRYAPSAPLADIARLLAAGRRFAFVGKPCDVAALRAMARSDPRVDALVPYMISFFCAGVPSLRGAQALLERMGVDEAEVAAFRYRGDGWPGQAAAMKTDGSRVALSYQESWGDVLSEHLQFRCKICPDGVGAFADVVCADAWACGPDGYPLFDERDGVSLILSRTARGDALVRAAHSAGRIQLAPASIDEIAAMQPGQRRRKSLALSRLVALRLVGGPQPSFRGFGLARAARAAGPAANLRSFLGALRRLVKARLPKPRSDV